MGQKRKFLLWTGGLFSLLLISVLVSIMLGSVHLPLSQTVKILLSPMVNWGDKPWGVAQETIIWQLRMPRIFLALVVGAMLASSGVAFQGILRNPLADPYILGVSSGAALGAAVFILFSQQFAAVKVTLPLFAFLGALLSLGAALLLAQDRGSRGGDSLILAGVVIQSLVGALLSFLIAISGQQLQQIVFWMMGSLANREWSDVLTLLPYCIVGLIYLSLQGRNLNILALGERSATHLGLNVERKKIIILVVASLLSGSAVAVVGIIGFVGLVIPHLMRLLVGPDHRLLFPVSVLAGAIFLLWSDTLARTISTSTEVPIGVVTAVVGAPFFAYLLRKGQRRKPV